jgi:hypothetical protein
MITGLYICLIDQPVLIAHIPNNIFLDEIIKRGQESVTKRGDIFFIRVCHKNISLSLNRKITAANSPGRSFGVSILTDCILFHK